MSTRLENRGLRPRLIKHWTLPRSEQKLLSIWGSELDSLPLSSDEIFSRFDQHARVEFLILQSQLEVSHVIVAFNLFLAKQEPKLASKQSSVNCFGGRLGSPSSRK